MDGLASAHAEMGPLASARVRELVEAVGFPGLDHLAKTSAAEATAGGAGVAAGGEEGPRTAGAAEPAATASDDSGTSPATLAAIEELKQHLRRVLAELALEKPALVRCLQATAQCMISSRMSLFDCLCDKEARALYEIGAAAEDPDGASSVSDASSEASPHVDLFLACVGAVEASLLRITSLMAHCESDDAQSPEYSPAWKEGALHPLTIMVAAACLFWQSSATPPPGKATHRLAEIRCKPEDSIAGAIFAARLVRRTLLHRLAQESDLRELGGLGKSLRVCSLRVCSLRVCSPSSVDGAR